MNELVTANDILVYLSIIHKGNWDDIAASLRKKMFFPPEEVKAVIAEVKAGYVTYFDDDYPPSFRDCPKAPYVLFYRGDLRLLHDRARCLSIVAK